MNTATKIDELAVEYARFQKLDKDKLDLKDHIMLYESLINKIEKAGLSFYDVSKRSMSISLSS
ncbi:MAG: hypothetical protein RIM99_10155 [Cyclobacteriaceae bacterium]